MCTLALRQQTSYLPVFSLSVGSGYDVVDYIAGHISEPEIPSTRAVCQLGVVDAK